MSKIYITLLIAILVSSSVIAKDCKSIPGEIQYNKNSLSVGDKVWIFNANTMPALDTNGYIRPHNFKQATEGVVVSEPNKYGAYKIYIKNSSGHSTTFLTHHSLPRQNVVSWNL